MYISTVSTGSKKMRLVDGKSQAEGQVRVHLSPLPPGRRSNRPSLARGQGPGTRTQPTMAASLSPKHWQSAEFSGVRRRPASGPGAAAASAARHWQAAEVRVRRRVHTSRVACTDSERGAAGAATERHLQDSSMVLLALVRVAVHMVLLKCAVHPSPELFSR